MMEGHRASTMNRASNQTSGS